MRPEARWVRATVTFDLGGEGAWSLFLDSGRAALSAVPSARPDLVIRTTGSILADILEGRRPGYEPFLAGRLEVRGNLSLALELESLFEPVRAMPPGWPRVIHPRVGNIRWSVLEAGPPDAPPVLVFHGLGATKATLLPTVAALSSQFRVLACDLPGFGDSAKPVAPYDPAWFAARVVELLDELEIKRAGLIGNSLGGRVALECGIRAPERVTGLVLLCPALAFLRFRQGVPFARLARPELGLIPVSPRRTTAVRMMRSCFAHPDRVPPSWIEAAVDEFFRVYHKPRGRLAFLAAGRHLYLDEPNGDGGFWKRLGGLEVPVQFVFGRRDPLVPSAFARYVADALPQARIAIFDDCGHVPQLEEPDRTHKLARSLLLEAGADGHRAGGPSG